MTARIFRPFIAFASAVALALPATALEVGGVRFDDVQTVAGKTLQLNGAAMRQILVIKFFAIGLYVEKKSTNAADILAATGPRRVQIHLQRETSSDELGQAFVTAMNKNNSKEEKGKVVAQTTAFGEIFANLGTLKKGDVMTLDWVPGKGTVASLNGKPIGEPLPDIAFHNAVLRIWLGDAPAQANMKPALLGEKG
ncbi:chalcone isomerase family protein [Curvibacter sp. APW13]|uniref:chalcone isomerase family protein n=1 Tax=Curvibacter sp. APW13 TaxID=3077236 RepID=UPI0028DDDE17|nr:chalcone isomerase family protein [Curvibacter sp. APW13]MDT8990952.1 chalcone isomerase family protein [Curvibacter sp. APW13]